MIQTRELTRSFSTKSGTVEAVRGVDIDVGPGELVAFLGPNGAGKSTTLRMLTTLLAPTSGSAAVAGHDVAAAPREVRRRIGYVGQDGSAADDQLLRDELCTQGRCHGLNKATARERARALLDSLQLGDLAKRQVKTLSGGQRRRLDIAMGLVHRPDLLFLDEPSAGLDPHSRANLWEHVARLRAEHGTTIFLTTHYLDEADSVAERVIVIDHGRIIADGTPEELKARVSGDLITLAAGTEPQAKAVARAAERMAKASQISIEETTVRLRIPDGDAALPELLGALHADGVRLAAVQVSRPTLDDVFLTLTGRSLREEAA